VPLSFGLSEGDFSYYGNSYGVWFVASEFWQVTVSVSRVVEQLTL